MKLARKIVIGLLWVAVIAFVGIVAWVFAGFELEREERRGLEAIIGTWDKQRRE